MRDLAVYQNGILILSGPSADGPGSYAVYWWKFHCAPAQGDFVHHQRC
ncbi:hypothetical protein [Bradyrhizobium sp. i1.15.2]